MAKLNQFFIYLLIYFLEGEQGLISCSHLSQPALVQHVSLYIVNDTYLYVLG